MRPRARRARAMLRYRRRGYGPSHRYVIKWLRGNGPLLDPGKMQSAFLDSI